MVKRGYRPARVPRSCWCVSQWELLAGTRAGLYLAEVTVYLFICSLFCKAFSATKTNYIASNDRVISACWIGQGFWRKRPWPNSEVSPRHIPQKGLSKTTKNISQDSRPPGRDLKLGPPKYAGWVTTGPRRSVAVKFCDLLSAFLTSFDCVHPAVRRLQVFMIKCEEIFQ
jgi:hypothetical protein